MKALIFQIRKMALFRPARQLKQLQTFILKRSQVFNQGVQRSESRSKFLPIFWNFGKTLVTSKVYFKSDSDKSKSLVNRNDIKIVELEEVEEEDGEGEE